MGFWLDSSNISNNFKNCNLYTIEASSIKSMCAWQSKEWSLLFIFSPLGLYPYCLHPVQSRNENSSLEADIRNCRLWLNSRLWNYTEKNFKIKPYTILGKIRSDKCRCKQGEYEDQLKYFIWWVCLSNDHSFCWGWVYNTG